MKKFSKIILFVIIFFNIYNIGETNPLSNILSFFQRDLVIDVIYKNHSNLIQASKVYLADDPDGPKTLIGEVTKVSLIESQMSKIELTIDKKYKNKIYETTRFVLINNIFSETSNAYIVAVFPQDINDKKNLESGASVKGMTFLEYKIAITGEGLKKMMNSIGKQNNELLTQLEEYIDALNTEEFKKKTKELADQITQFSKEQKEAFKKEVLPKLKNMFNSIMEQLEKQEDKEKSKDLEKQLQEIEKRVDV